MDALIAPGFGTFPEQGGVRRPAERRAPAVPDQAVADVVVDRDQMPRHRRCFDDRAEFGLLVMRDDQGRQQRRWVLGGYCRCFCGEAHAAALSARCHSCRATASAASTDRLSISVPVVRWSKPGGNMLARGNVASATAV